MREFLIRKLGPPVLGTFVVVWAVLHWDHLASLFWGSDLLEQRVDEFKLAIDQAWYKKYGIPFVLASIYLLGLPYLSYVVNKLQTHVRKINSEL